MKHLTRKNIKKIEEALTVLDYIESDLDTLYIKETDSATAHFIEAVRKMVEAARHISWEAEGALEDLQDYLKRREKAKPCTKKSKN